MDLVDFLLRPPCDGYKTTVHHPLLMDVYLVWLGSRLPPCPRPEPKPTLHLPRPQNVELTTAEGKILFLLMPFFY